MIEASVGIGVGTVFLAREGLSFAMLKDLEPRRARPRTSSSQSADSPLEPNRPPLASRWAYMFGMMKKSFDRFGATSQALSPPGCTWTRVPPGDSDRSRSASAFASSSSAAPTSR